MVERIAADKAIGKYLKEGLLAMVPVYRQGDAATDIYTQQGVHRDPRNINWLSRRFAAHYCLDINQLRRHYSNLLDLKHNVSLPMDSCLVLLPFKYRNSDKVGEVTMGYINLLQVQEIIKPAGKEENAAILFKTGLKLTSLNTTATLKERLDQGRRAHKDFLNLVGKTAVPPRGLSTSELMELLPPCQCALKDLFLKIFNKD